MRNAASRERVIAWLAGGFGILALLLSGILMELSLLPIAITPDYRYSHWLVICACTSLAMLVARRARPVL